MKRHGRVNDRSRFLCICFRWKSTEKCFTSECSNVNAPQRTTNASQTSICRPSIEMCRRISERCLRAGCGAMLQSWFRWCRHSGKAILFVVIWNERLIFSGNVPAKCRRNINSENSVCLVKDTTIQMIRTFSLDHVGYVTDEQSKTDT